MTKNNTTTAPAITENDYQKWIAEKTAQFNEWKKASEIGTMTDDSNPMFTFGMTATSILVDIASGKISAQFLVAMELANRGVDKAGKWVGFEQAQKIHFS